MSQPAPTAAAAAAVWRVCANAGCETRFPHLGTARKFCSEACRRQNRRQQTIRNCANPGCAKPFRPNGRRLTCSPECAQERRRANEPPAQPEPANRCTACGQRSLETIDGVTWCWYCQQTPA